MTTVRRTGWGVAVACAVALLAADAHAYEKIGRRRFIEPFATRDANPQDQLLLTLPSWVQSRQGRKLSLGYTIERRLTYALSASLGSAWINDHPTVGAHENGGANLDLSFKYTAKIDRRREMVWSVGAGAVLPVGDHDVGAGGDPVLRPTVMVAKGFGDLPDDLWRLQPVAVMADAALEAPIGTDTAGDAVTLNALLLYSLPYLETYVWDPRLPPVVRDLTPLVEFSFRSTINGPHRPTAAFVAPALFYSARWYQLGVGGRLPANDTAHRELRWAVLGMIDVSYDQMVPALFGTPWFR